MRSGESVANAQDIIKFADALAGGYERIVLDGIGHFVQREQPEAVIKTIKKFALKKKSA